jgi:hypothetical protein
LAPPTRDADGELAAAPIASTQARDRGLLKMTGHRVGAASMRVAGTRTAHDSSQTRQHGRRLAGRGGRARIGSRSLPQISRTREAVSDASRGGRRAGGGLQSKRC